MKGGISAGGAVALSLGGVVVLGAVAAGGYALYKALERRPAPAGPVPGAAGSSVTVLGSPALPPVGGLSGPGVTVGNSSAAPTGPVVTATPSGVGVSASSGSSAPNAPAQTVQLGNGLSQSYYNNLEQEQRKTDKITDAKRELSDVFNRIKVMSAELREIDSRPIESGIRDAVANQHYNDCRSHSDAWNFIFSDPCGDKRNVTTEGYDVILADRWKQRLAEIKAPRLAELSSLNRRQLDLIADLESLGVRTARTTEGDEQLQKNGVNPTSGGSKNFFASLFDLLPK